MDEFSEQQATTHDAFGTFYLFLEAINTTKHCPVLTFPQKPLICIHNCALLTTVFSLPQYFPYHSSYSSGCVWANTSRAEDTAAAQQVVFLPHVQCSRGV